MKRLFIGIPIESESAAIQAKNWKNSPELNGHVLKWLNFENWHVTLIFLGDTPETTIPKLQELITQFFAGIQSFSTNLRGTGVFPNSNNPKVLWLGIENLQPLMPAQIRLVDALKQNGFLLENKPLKPHLTLARIKNSANRIAIDSLIGQYQYFDFGSVTIDRVILYESISTPGGPVYQPLFVSRLIR
ncbi:MAG: RNA 2',3'-cyclic phosphodiesterase [Bacteroidota bacterium]|nr:RNA 2',3'-cyclic phosphodiesterase [Odoribacter sp.]MDP3643875.1 RNA 2',3'-cyclic phosphodiesterase [Bacteroidota bacterium]